MEFRTTHYTSLTLPVVKKQRRGESIEIKTKKKKKGILGVEENGDISGQKTRNQRKWEDGKLALLQ